MGDCLRAGIPPWYVTKPTRSTQPCIPLGSLNRVLALIGWGKGGNVTYAGWQVTLCDPIWHASSRSGAVLVAQTAIRFFAFTLHIYTHAQFTLHDNLIPISPSQTLILPSHLPPPSLISHHSKLPLFQSRLKTYLFHKSFSPYQPSVSHFMEC